MAKALFISAVLLAATALVAAEGFDGRRLLGKGSGFAVSVSKTPVSGAPAGPAKIGADGKGEWVPCKAPAKGGDDDDQEAPKAAGPAGPSRVGTGKGVPVSWSYGSTLIKWNVKPAQVIKNDRIAKAPMLITGGTNALINYNKPPNACWRYKPSGPAPENVSWSNGANIIRYSPTSYVIKPEKVSDVTASGAAKHSVAVGHSGKGVSVGVFPAGSVTSTPLPPPPPPAPAAKPAAPAANPAEPAAAATTAAPAAAGDAKAAPAAAGASKAAPAAAGAAAAAAPAAAAAAPAAAGADAAAKP